MLPLPYLPTLKVLGLVYLLLTIINPAHDQNLTLIILPASVTSIGKGAFALCKSLTAIEAHRTNKNYSGSKDGVLFNKNFTELIAYPAGKKLSSYTVPDTVTRIGDGAFSFCGSLASINLPAGLTSIGDGAFEGCESLTSIN